MSGGCRKATKKGFRFCLPWIQGNIRPTPINKINFVNHFIITFGKVRFFNVKVNYYIFVFCKVF